MTHSLRVPRPIRVPLLARDSGPGLRWLLFTQGCAHPCTRNCLNPLLLDSAGGVATPVDELLMIAGQVAAGTWGPAEGVTVLGGEPTDQAKPLRAFLGGVQELGLSVMLYSGHHLSWFHHPRNRDAAALIEVADILIDGPFRSLHADPELRWRGSRNQRVILLSDRYSERDVEASQLVRGVTLNLSNRATMVSGLQARAGAERIERILLGEAAHERVSGI